MYRDEGGGRISPLSPSSFVSAQSNPAPALANTLTLRGSNPISSASHFPISPPVPQNGLKIASNSPHRPSRSAAMNSPLSRSDASGLIISHCDAKEA